MTESGWIWIICHVQFRRKQTTMSEYFTVYYQRVCDFNEQHVLMLLIENRTCSTHSCCSLVVLNRADRADVSNHSQLRLCSDSVTSSALTAALNTSAAVVQITITHRRCCSFNLHFCIFVQPESHSSFSLCIFIFPSVWRLWSRCWREAEDKHSWTDVYCLFTAVCFS